MKICADEHVSPRIVQAIRPVLHANWSIISILEEKFAGNSDIYWITQFSQNGGDVILSADRDFLNKMPLVEAISNTGLKMIHLPRRWARSPRHLQAAHILRWWKKIEEALEVMYPGEYRRTKFTMKEPRKLEVILPRNG